MNWYLPGRLFVLLALTVTLIPLPVQGQPDTLWTTLHDITKWDSVFDAVRLEDGFLYTGDMYSDSTAYITAVRTDLLGNMLWYEYYLADPHYAGYCYDIIEENVDTLLLIGCRESMAADWDTYVIRICEDGSYLDHSYYAMQLNQFAKCATVTDDGGIIIGVMEGFWPDADICILKLDSNLEMEWYKKLDKPGYNEPYVILEIENGYLIGGNSYQYGHMNCCIVNTDFSGELLERFDWGNNDWHDRVEDLVEYAPGKFLGIRAINILTDDNGIPDLYGIDSYNSSSLGSASTLFSFDLENGVETLTTISGSLLIDMAPRGDGTYLITGSYFGNLLLSCVTTGGMELWRTVIDGGTQNDMGMVICPGDDYSTTVFSSQNPDPGELDTRILGFESYLAIEPSEPIDDDLLHMSLGPNPFTSHLDISINLVQAQDISLGVFDITGRCVYHISTTMHSGENTLRWITNDETAEGCYFVRISSPNEIITESCLLIR